MIDKSKFVAFFPVSNGKRISETKEMSPDAVRGIFSHYADWGLIECWMQSTRRGEYYHGDGMVLLCVSGRRRISRGMKSEELMARCLEGVR